MTEPFITLTDVAKQFGDVRVLEGVTCSIRPGRSYALVGPSGSGKSTLLSIIGLLSRPSSGSVVVEGRPCPHGEREAAELRRQRIAWVFQRPVLLSGQSLLDNVVTPALLRGVPRAEAIERARRSIADVGLAHREQTRAQFLSGGEQQRMETARAMSVGVPLILTDEPTASLDWASAERVADALMRATDDGAALVVCTHDERVAAKCDVTLRLEAGRLQPSTGAADAD